jgi:hypothetical protein
LVGIEAAVIAIFKILLLDKWHLHEKLQRVLRKVLRISCVFLVRAKTISPLSKGLQLQL